jgi:ATP-dependent RNA helicase DeaD
VAISLITPLEKYKLRQIERQTKQSMTLGKIPTRAEIAARHLERLRNQVREAITSERLASFLPIVSQLSEEYDIHTIAAAALQMAYDHTVPAWQRTDSYSQDPAPRVVPSPKKNQGKRSPETVESSPSLDWS